MLDQHVRVFEEYQPKLISLAQEATQFSVQYRQFHVGCAMLAWSATKGYQIFLGTNMKQIPDVPKVCAEQVALGSALVNGFELIIGLCVAADKTQRDDDSGVLNPTLQPCKNCRIMLSHTPAVEPDTLVLTVINHRGPRELHTVGEILHIHSHPLLMPDICLLPAGLMN